MLLIYHHSGKSSFVLLLLGLLEPVEESDNAASLLIDGIPISSIDRQILRQHLITVPQDPVFLYKGSTIAQNLDPTGLANPEQLAAVVQDLDLQNAIDSQGG